MARLSWGLCEQSPSSVESTIEFSGPNLFEILTYPSFHGH